MVARPKTLHDGSSRARVYWEDRVIIVIRSSYVILVQLANFANTCTCFNLRRATRVVTQIFDEQLKPSGLLITQFAILVEASVIDGLGKQQWDSLLIALSDTVSLTSEG